MLNTGLFVVFAASFFHSRTGRGWRAMLNLHDAKAVVVVVGSVPGRPGGAWAMARGRTPRECYGTARR